MEIESYVSTTEEELQALIDEEKKQILKKPASLDFWPQISKQSLNLLCAKTNGGKSSNMMMIARILAERYCVLYISLENSARQDHINYLAACHAAGLKTEASMIRIGASEDFSWGDIARQARTGIDVVFVDGLDYGISESGSSDNVNALYKSELKFIREIFPNHALFVGWQLGRQYREGLPCTEDIAKSMDVARMADSIVCIAHVPESKTRILYATKGREGMSDVCATWNWGDAYRMIDRVEAELILRGKKDATGRLINGKQKIKTVDVEALPW